MNSLGDSKKRRVILATYKEKPDLPTSGYGRLDHIQQQLKSEDIDLEAAPWDDPDVNWSIFDMVIISGVANYTNHVDDFRKWLDKLESLGVYVQNPPEMVRWNMDKTYMLDLLKWGCPAVDTVVVESADFTLEKAVRIAGERSWREFVIKPTIGASSKFVYKISINSDLTYCCEDDIPIAAMKRAAPSVLLQKFLPSIYTAGELRVVVISGQPVFSYRKYPPTGDFRLGSIAPELFLETETPVSAFSLAVRVFQSIIDMSSRSTTTSDNKEEDVLTVSPASTISSTLSPASVATRGQHKAPRKVPLYCRIDLLQDENEQYVVGEVELIEPMIPFSIHSQGFDIYTQAITKELMTHNM